MKKTLLILCSLASAVSLASAQSTIVTYMANDAAGNSDDGIDQNLNIVQVWTQTQSPTGGSGGGYGSWTMLEPYAWQIWSYPDGNNVNGSITETHTFAGGPLAVGQTVSLLFANSAINPPQTVGIDLLNGSGSAIQFGFLGGGPNNYYYTDSSSSFASAGSMGFLYHSGFTVSITVTGAGTYSAVAGSDSWSGTFNGSLVGIDVFDNAGGNGSDVGFNDLSISVPEPSTLAMLAVGSVGFFGWRRISRRA